MSMTDAEHDAMFEAHAKLVALALQHPVKNKYHAAVVASGIKIDDEVPLCGFYRTLDRETKNLEGVFIDFDGSEYTIEYGKDRMERRIGDVWPTSLWNPVSYDYWISYVTNGVWPDDKDAKVEDPGDWRADGSAPPAGDNKPPEEVVDPESFEGLQLALAKEVAKIPSYAKIEDDDTLKASQSLFSAIKSISTKLDNMRKALVRPFLDGQQAINWKFNPIINKANDYAAQVERPQLAYATALLKAKRDKEAAEAAERARQAEEARKANLPPPPAVETKPLPTAPMSFRGASGKVKTIEEVSVIPDDGVTDWAALFAFFGEDADMRALALKKARKLLKDSGKVAPGVRTELVMARAS